MERVSSLVTVVVALLVARFTILEPVEVLEVLFLPVTLEETAAALHKICPLLRRNGTNLA